MKKIRIFLSKQRNRIIASLITGGYVATNSILMVHADSGLGSNLSNASGGLQSEALSWADGLGVTLLIVCGVLAAINKRQMAIGLLISGGMGYLIIKQANVIWPWLKSLFG